MYQNTPKNSYNFKSQIFYARTYRHLQFNLRSCLIYILLFVIPAVILLLFSYEIPAAWMCSAAEWFLDNTADLTAEILSCDFIPSLGAVSYLTFETTVPNLSFVLWNLAVTLLLVTLLNVRPLRGHPLSIFLNISLFVHTISCVFFLLAGNLFPYEAADYSKLYVQQQVSIWIAFLILMGLVEGILGRCSIFFRILITLSLLLYSFLFGTIRYCLFLWLLHQASVLYMPVMFFTLGPFFDFLYFVMIYAVSTESIIAKNEHEYQNEWDWA